jgi:NSS family neurotransmitter:Na+ symporter
MQTIVILGNKAMNKKDNSSGNAWSSKIGFILASAGSAVGLGNIWRFPYLVAEHSGGTFIFLYFLCVLFLGLPILLSEFIFGRYVGDPIFVSVKKRFTNIKYYHLYFYMSFVAVLLVLSFYFVVCGWTTFYFIQSVVGTIQYAGGNAVYYQNIFNGLLASPSSLIVYTFIFIVGTSLVNYLGLAEGVERANVFVLPLLFILLIIMIGRALTLDGAMSGVKYILQFDVTAINPQMFIAALGQAFFSLSIGIGTMLIFSSYVKKDFNLKSSAIYTVFIGSGVGVFTSLLIIPVVFAFHYDLNSGPALTFLTLPIVFASMDFGSLLASAFFLVMLMASLTSTISLVETALPSILYVLKTSRRVSIIIFTFLCMIVSTIQALSFNLLGDVKVFGLTTFDLANSMADYLLILGALVICFIIGWKLPINIVFNEVTNNGTIKFKLFRIYLFIVKFMAPAIILLILFNKFMSI